MGLGAERWSLHARNPHTNEMVSWKHRTFRDRLGLSAAALHANRHHPRHRPTHNPSELGVPDVFKFVGVDLSLERTSVHSYSPSVADGSTARPQRLSSLRTIRCMTLHPVSATDTVTWNEQKQNSRDQRELFKFHLDWGRYSTLGWSRCALLRAVCGSSLSEGRQLSGSKLWCGL